MIKLIHNFIKQKETVPKKLNFDTASYLWLSIKPYPFGD